LRLFKTRFRLENESLPSESEAWKVWRSIVPGGLVDTTGAASFNAFRSALSNAEGITLAPGETKTLPLSYDRSAAVRAKALGWIVVTLDDPNGARQADLVPLGTPGKP